MRAFERVPPSRVERSLAARACALVALLATLLVFAAAVAWARDNELPTFWDEANYFGDSASDYYAIRDHRPLKQRVLTLLKTDVGQPPAHRGVLALTLIFGPRSGVLRFASLAGLLLSLAFVYAAGKQVGGTTAGALAALAVLASPIVIASSLRFGTEYTLYLAESATLYFLLTSLRRTQARRRDIVGLALALGLGLWSKPSFVLVAVPALVTTFVFSYRKLCGPPYRWLIKACALGGLLGAIYLVPFSLKTLDYLNRSVNKMGGRHSLGEPSLSTFVKYVPIVVSTVTGPVVAALIALAVVGAAAVWFAKRTAPARAVAPQWAAVAICFAASALLPLSHFFSADHDMRYLSGDVFPLSLYLGIALSNVVLNGIPVLGAVVAFAIFAQIATMLLPIVRRTPLQRFEDFQRKTVVSNTGNSVDVVFAPQERWNWEKLRETCGISTLHDPVIGYVGAGEPFNEKQLFYAWMRHDEPVRVIRMWKYTQGPIDWRGAMHLANNLDVVLTAPGYRGLAADKQPLDNVNNDAFAARLERDPHFRPPLTLTFGRFEPTAVLTFINKRTHLDCPAPPSVGPQPRPSGSRPDSPQAQRLPTHLRAVAQRRP